MNTYVVEISNSSNCDWYYGMEGTRLEVYQGRKSYMVKQDYDNYVADNHPVRGIDFKDCEKVCVTCGHIESQHRTAGGFCKHCPCVKFQRRRTSRALDGAKAPRKLKRLTGSPRQ